MSSKHSGRASRKASTLGRALLSSETQVVLRKVRLLKKAVSTLSNDLGSPPFLHPLTTSSPEYEQLRLYLEDRLTAVRLSLSTVPVALGYAEQCLVDIVLQNQNKVE